MANRGKDYLEMDRFDGGSDEDSDSFNNMKLDDQYEACDVDEESPMLTKRENR